MEHIILVAFDVNHLGDAKEAQEYLMELLPKPSDTQEQVPASDPAYDPDRPYLDSWWIAEDERYDRSDNDSAVFVPMGTQEQAQVIAPVLREGTWQRDRILDFLAASGPGEEDPQEALRGLRDEVMLALNVTEADLQEV